MDCEALPLNTPPFDPPPWPPFDPSSLTGHSTLLLPVYCRLPPVPLCNQWGGYLQAHAGKGGSRAVYIAPKEELAKERFADWTQKFGAPGLGLNVCLLTGDPLADYAMLREANIVISTPEHWDMLSRRWRQQSRKEVRNVALFLVDELHLIGGANGPVLEVGCK